MTAPAIAGPIMRPPLLVMQSGAQLDAVGGAAALLGLGVACPHRVLALHHGDGFYGMGPADRCRTCLGQAEVLHLTGSDELLDGPGDVLDWDVRIDAVLVEEIDPIRAQTGE